MTVQHPYIGIHLSILLSLPPPPPLNSPPLHPNTYTCAMTICISFASSSARSILSRPPASTSNTYFCTAD